MAPSLGALFRASSVSVQSGRVRLVHNVLETAASAVNFSALGILATIQVLGLRRIRLIKPQTVRLAQALRSS